MPAWRVSVTTRAARQLRKLDRRIGNEIKEWLKANIEGTDNPRRLGGILNGDYAGMWRYRVGEYRVLCELYDETCTVVAVSIGHRRQVYSHTYTPPSRRR